MNEFVDAFKRKLLSVVVFVFFTAFFSYLMMSSPEVFVASDNFVPPHARIVAFGDSLTAGYALPAEDAFPAQLQNILKAKGYDVEVINQGISGDTTSGALQRLPRILEFRPDIVILEFGANDVLKRQSIDAARDNLVFVINKLKEWGAIVLLAGLLPPEYISVGFSDDNFYPSIAKETDIALYPNFMTGIYDQSTIPTDLVLPDKVHPTPEGAKLMAENIAPFVERTLQAFYQQVRNQQKQQQQQK